MSFSNVDIPPPWVLDPVWDVSMRWYPQCKWSDQRESCSDLVPEELEEQKEWGQQIRKSLVSSHLFSLGALSSCLMWLRMSGTCTERGPAFWIWTVPGSAASTESLSQKCSLRAGMTWQRWNISSGNRTGGLIKHPTSLYELRTQSRTMFFLLHWLQVMGLVSEGNHEKFSVETVAGSRAFLHYLRIAVGTFPSFFSPHPLSYLLLLLTLFGRKIVLSKEMWNILDVLHWGHV